MNRSCSFSLRISYNLLDRLERAVKDGKFASIAEAIRTYTEVGMHVETYKTLIKDPEFLKSIEELKMTEGIFKWTETLTEQQADAVATALKMEKEKRYENRTWR